MSTITFTSKNTFIVALEARRPFWQEYDRKQTEKHQAQEQAWLEDAKAKCHRFIEMSYEEIKAEGTYGYSLHFGSFPGCPILMESRLDKMLSVLGYTQAKTFRVTEAGVWGDAYTLLAWDPYAKTTVC